jgi:ubiquinone/menaquinone biosynthesis C-methylase UbiE
MLPVAEFLATKKLPPNPFSDLALLRRIQTDLRQLLREDADRIAQGYYPASVLAKSEPAVNPISHLQRLPRIFRDAMESAKRRAGKRTKEFSAAAKVRKNNLPEYYQRNFHFQTDGYLGEESAALYDHQVEILFAGTADSMRRMLLAPLKRHFLRSDGEGLRFLELACGSGSSTNFLRLAFPKAEIVAIDLSEPYLEVARQRVPSAHFELGQAEALRFESKSFDAVVSVFLFHELPKEVREKVLAESRRVLKPKGMMAFVDSLQLGDKPYFDKALKDFPVNFHEPFYPNYAQNPMEELISQAGFVAVERGFGFFSKMVAAIPLPETAGKPAKSKVKSKPSVKKKRAASKVSPRRA